MTDSRESQIAQALANLQTRLARAAEAAGRKADEIELLAITKFFPASDIAILADLGCRAFGESRDQEASRKVSELAGRLPADTRWHMVGQIQRNKARSIARWAHVAHSVSTEKVIAALGRAAEEALGDGEREAPLAVYLQLSLDGDESRGGVDINNTAQVDAQCAAVNASAGLDFVGFMAVPPLGADADQAFARLELERSRVQANYQHRLGLSAGMSGDLEAAVKHGSTCVRVGTALLGARPLTSP
ncbi:YggS family pyridoxal phosphate-dependent enzyme [Mycolicibacterium mengxianglii]|uniref:YggS family pyridoxal phosphate-dependent enzyme n=1 Tax=Mycolicibacterium mengxianglii TaxID=2736649 RepID=UPI0018EF1BCA|nr:YggS family pyridoxal phosphate-dependent enzyme [Mycolicibacterium mengxianglii]